MRCMLLMPKPDWIQIFVTHADVYARACSILRVPYGGFLCLISLCLRFLGPTRHAFLPTSLTVAPSACRIVNADAAPSLFSSTLADSQMAAQQDRCIALSVDHTRAILTTNACCVCPLVFVYVFSAPPACVRACVRACMRVSGCVRVLVSTCARTTCMCVDKEGVYRHAA